jgi:hypothetical protein
MQASPCTVIYSIDAHIVLSLFVFFVAVVSGFTHKTLACERLLLLLLNELQSEAIQL